MTDPRMDEKYLGDPEHPVLMRRLLEIAEGQATRENPTAVAALALRELLLRSAPQVPDLKRANELLASARGMADARRLLAELLGRTLRMAYDAILERGIFVPGLNDQVATIERLWPDWRGG